MFLEQFVYCGHNAQSCIVDTVSGQ